MSNVKKVLTLVACGCICLMVASSASADLTEVLSSNKEDADTAAFCTSGNGDGMGDPDILEPLTICNVTAFFDDPANRLLSVSEANVNALDGDTVTSFFHHPDNGAGFGVVPSICAVVDGNPDLICDTFVTIGVKCNSFNPPDGTRTDGDFLQFDFVANGLLFGGWFNNLPPNGQGDAGTYGDLGVLILQTAVPVGQRVFGPILINWQRVGQGEVFNTPAQVDCLAKCIEGAGCNDQDACTVNDMCNNGVCSGDDVVCNDDEECTDDACDPDTGNCVFTNNNIGCDDGDECTIDDACSGGSCQGGGDLDCDDENACTTDGCDSESGCTHDDIVCDDDDECTTDGCNMATGCTFDPDCTGDDPCDDGLLCTDDSCAEPCCLNIPIQCDPGDACNPDNGLCELIPCQIDEDCDDDDDCTADSCVDGGCNNVIISCDDQNDCTTDTCAKVGGCANTNNNDECDDGDACTDNDACSGGSCQGGGDTDCDDLNACTADTCDTDTGCAHEDISADCADDNDCTTDSCDEQDGCQNVNNDDVCDDGDLCTTGDACSGGACGGDDVDCGDELVCDPNTDEDGDGVGDCVEVADFLDIIPGKCPNALRRNGLGFVKISLLGHAELDVNDVDISTLVLRRTAPAGCAGSVAPRMNPRPHVRDRGTPFEGELCNCHSRRKDGTDDLDMKFKLAEVVNNLCLDQLTAGDEATLELTGLTFDLQPIRAADCVIVGRDLGPNP